MRFANHGRLNGMSGTVSRWRRLTYSFISILVAGTLVGLGASCREALFHNEHLNLEAGLAFGFFVSAVGLSGWLIAVPIVVLVRDYTGWRFWAWGAAGFAIGPAVVSGASLLVGFTGSAPYFLIATVVSGLSTAAYLLLVLRREQTTYIRREKFDS